MLSDSVICNQSTATQSSVMQLFYANDFQTETLHCRLNVREKLKIWFLTFETADVKLKLCEIYVWSSLVEELKFDSASQFDDNLL